MKIINEIKNELLQRKEVTAEIGGMSTPSTADMMKEFAKFFNVSEELVSVKKIESRFGTHNFLIKAFVYDSSEMKGKIEKKKIKKIEGGAK